MRPYRDIKKQKGSSLLEILITLVVLGIGLVSLAKFESGVKGSNMHASQHTEASYLAQKKIENLKDLRGSADFQALASSNGSTVVGSDHNTQYMLSWTVQPSGNVENYRAIEVTVAWTDKEGQLKKVSLHTLAGNEDVLRVATLSNPALNPALNNAGECQAENDSSHDGSDSNDGGSDGIDDDADNDGNDDGHSENDDGNSNDDSDSNDGGSDGSDGSDDDADNDGNDDGHSENDDGNSNDDTSNDGDSDGVANPCQPVEDSCDDGGQDGIDDDGNNDGNDDGHEENDDGQSDDTASPCNGSDVEEEDSSSDEDSDEDNATLEDFDRNMAEVENDNN